jgi:hypothetical protein
VTYRWLANTIDVLDGSQFYWQPGDGGPGDFFPAEKVYNSNSAALACASATISGSGSIGYASSGGIADAAATISGSGTVADDSPFTTDGTGGTSVVSGSPISTIAASITTAMADDIIFAIFSGFTTNELRLASVSGGGLQWARQAHKFIYSAAYPLCLEVWWAHAPDPLSNITVTGTLATNASGRATLSLVAVNGADISFPFAAHPSLPAIAAFDSIHGGGSASHAVTGISTVRQHAFELAILATRPPVTGTHAADTGWTLLGQESADSSALSCSVEGRHVTTQQAAASQNVFTSISSVTADYIAMVLALQPAMSPTWAGPRFVSCGATDVFSAASVTPTLPSNRVTGNLLLAHLSLTGQPASVTWPAGWTAIETWHSTAGGNNQTGSRAWRYVTGSETAPAITWSGGSSYYGMARVDQYTNVDQTNPIGAYSHGSANSAAITSAAIYTTRANSLVTNYVDLGAYSAPTIPPALYTARYSELFISPGVGGPQLSDEPIPAFAYSDDVSVVAETGGQWLDFLTEILCPLVSPSGTGALADSAATIVGVGLVLSAGAAAGSIYDLAATISGVGAGISTGSGALTPLASEIAGTGTSSSTGAGTLADAVVHVAATDISISTGTGAIHDAVATVSGVGKSTSTGTGAISDAAAVVSGTGKSSSVGTGVISDLAAVVAGADLSISTGSGAIHDAVATITGAGKSSSIGNGAIHDSAATISGAANSSSTSTGTLSDSAATISAVAGGLIIGTGALASSTSTISGLGSAIATGTGALDDADSAISGAGASRSTGTGALDDGAALISGAGTVATSGKTGTGSITDGAAVVHGVGTASAAGLISYIGSASGASTNSPTVVSAGLSGKAGDVVVAIVGAYSTHLSESFASVTGGGFTWNRRKSADQSSSQHAGHYFHLETWWARATSDFAGMAVTANIDVYSATTSAVIEAFVARNVKATANFDPNASLEDVAKQGRTKPTHTHNVAGISTTNPSTLVFSALFSLSDKAGNDTGWSSIGSAANVGIIAAQYEIRSTALSSLAQNVKATTNCYDFIALVDALQAAPVPATGRGAIIDGPAKIAGIGLALPRAQGQLYAQAAHVAGSGKVINTGTGALQSNAAIIASAESSSASSAGAIHVGPASISGAAQSISAGHGALHPAAAHIAGAARSRSTGTGALGGLAHVSGSGATRSTGAGAIHDAAAAIDGTGLTRSAGTGALHSVTTISGSGYSLSRATIAALVDAASDVSANAARGWFGQGALLDASATVDGTGSVAWAGTRPALTVAPASVEGLAYSIATGDGDLIVRTVSVSSAALSESIATGTLIDASAGMTGEGIDPGSWGAGELVCDLASIVAQPQPQSISTGTGNLRTYNCRVTNFAFGDLRVVKITGILERDVEMTGALERKTEMVGVLERDVELPVP